MAGTVIIEKRWLSWVVILSSSILVGYGGCRTTEDIKGRDSGVFFPSVRLTKDLSGIKKGQNNDVTVFKRKRGSRPTLVAELDYYQGSGMSSQEIGGIDFLDFNGVTFDGPVRIKADSELQVLSIALRGVRAYHGGIDRVEPFIGLGIQHLDLELASSDLTVRDDILTIGPMIGVQFTIDLLSWLDLSARGSFTLGFGRDFVALTSMEAGIVISIIPHLDFKGGWRYLIYKNNRENSEANVDLKFSGPTAGIHLIF